MRRSAASFFLRAQRSFERRPGALIDDLSRRSPTTSNTFHTTAGTPHVIGQIPKTLNAKQHFSPHLLGTRSRKYNDEHHTTNHVCSFTHFLGLASIRNIGIVSRIHVRSLQLKWLSRFFRCAVWRRMASHSNSAIEHLVEVARPTQSLSRDDARVLERMVEVAKIHLQGCDASLFCRTAQTMLAILCCRRHSDPGFGQSGDHVAPFSVSSTRARRVVSFWWCRSLCAALPFVVLSRQLSTHVTRSLCVMGLRWTGFSRCVFRSFWASDNRATVKCDPTLVSNLEAWQAHAQVARLGGTTLGWRRHQW